jgi:hypothetical protein
MKPIFLRRSFRTASFSPQLVGQLRDLVVSEYRHTVLVRLAMQLLRLLKSFLGMFQSVSGLLMATLVILLAVMILGDTMRMSRVVVQFSGALMVFVVRSAVVTR